jgi:hypothetical protein
MVAQLVASIQRGSFAANVSNVTVAPLLTHI